MCEYGTDFKGDYRRRTFYVRESKWGIPKALREKESYSGAKGKGQLYSAVCRERRNYRGWGKFYGFAVLPVGDIDSALTELERAIKILGLRGIIFNGAFQESYFDAERFFPIFEKARELKVPVMLHPGEVPTEVAKTYYKGSWPEAVANVFAGHGIGWHYDAGVQYMRMIFCFAETK